MGTVIDELVVLLNLDASKFTQQQKTALDSFKKTHESLLSMGKDVESQGAKVTEFFSRMKTSMLGTAAIFLGGMGIKEFIGYVTGLDAATGRMAKTMNVSTEELSAWQGAFKQIGGSAESATGALAGLSGEMNRFMLTGQTSMLPILNSLGIGLKDAKGNLKTSTQLLLEMADAVKGMDAARATALLSMVPGMNQDAINLLLEGRSKIEDRLAASAYAGGSTGESAALSQRYQTSSALLERSMTNLGRIMVVAVAPALSAVANKITELLSFWYIKPGTPEAKKVSQEFEESREKHLGNSKSTLEWLRDNASFTDGDRAWWQSFIDEWYGDKGGAKPSGASGSSAASGSGPNASEMEAYIRQQAIKRGIDPNVAVKVAKSEGLYNYVGDKGTSFGPFQLHYKNNIPGLSNAGLGDDFTRDTGSHASDPSTWKKQVTYALDYAKTHGWGAWHGHHGMPFEGIGTTGAAGAAAAAAGVTNSSRSSTSSVHVENLTVHTTADGDKIAADVKAALERQSFAAAANYGQQ